MYLLIINYGLISLNFFSYYHYYYFKQVIKINANRMKRKIHSIKAIKLNYVHCARVKQYLGTTLNQYISVTIVEKLMGTIATISISTRKLEYLRY